MTDKNFIISSAIHDKNFTGEVIFNPKNIKEGLVVYGPRHSHCYEALRLIYTMNELEKINHKNVIQGFVTSQNIFVDRKEAYQIAKLAGQLICKRQEEEHEPLFSEDLY